MRGPAKRVCVLGLGGGGFHCEAERLFSMLRGELELVLIYAIDSQTTGNWQSPFPVQSAYVVRSPALYGDPLWKRGVMSLLAFWRVFWILLATRPDCIVAMGTAQAVPFGAVGRLLGIPMFYVESITRVVAPSRTGRIIDQAGLAARHYSQWPGLTRRLRSSYFRGNVLR